MPFDKHIIGQVPAVIRAAFNVSKLQKEDGTLGPRAVRSPLPSPPDICRTTREGLTAYSDRVQLWLKARLGSVIPGDKAQERSTQESNLHAVMELSAGGLDSSVLSQGCDSRATLSCLLNMFH